MLKIIITTVRKKVRNVVQNKTKPQKCRTKQNKTSTDRVHICATNLLPLPSTATVKMCLVISRRFSLPRRHKYVITSNHTLFKSPFGVSGFKAICDGEYSLTKSSLHITGLCFVSPNPFFFKSVTTAEKTAADEEYSGSFLVSISHFLLNNWQFHFS